MSQEMKPAWLKSKDEFGQEIHISPITHDREVLIGGKTNLEEEIESIYNAIEDISLTPGPQGPQGLRGERGAKGIVVSETEPDDPEIELWIEPQFDISHIINLDDYYKKSEVDEKVDGLDDRVTPLEHQVDELLNPLQIRSFTCQPSLVEIGTVLPSLTLNWSYNRDIKAQRLNGEDVETTARTQVLEGIFENSQTFRLEADGYSKTVQATTAFSVMNQIYYGSSEPAATVPLLISRLTKELRQTKSKTFSTTCREGQHIYYAYPARYGNATFMVGGFEGGFDKLSTVEITNGSHYTELYHVYQSTNQNLGVTTVTVA